VRTRRKRKPKKEGSFTRGGSARVRTLGKCVDAHRGGGAARVHLIDTYFSKFYINIFFACIEREGYGGGGGGGGGGRGGIIPC
jgi:hypothetical protein